MSTSNLMRVQMRQLRQDSFRRLAAPEPETAALGHVLAGMNRTHFEMEHAVADYLLALMRHLTPEQRSAFVQLMARHAGMQEESRRLPRLGPGGAQRPDERR